MQLNNQKVITFISCDTTCKTIIHLPAAFLAISSFQKFSEDHTLPTFHNTAASSGQEKEIRCPFVILKFHQQISNLNTAPL